MAAAQRSRAGTGSSRASNGLATGDACEGSCECGMAQRGLLPAPQALATCANADQSAPRSTLAGSKRVHRAASFSGSGLQPWGSPEMRPRSPQSARSPGLAYELCECGRTVFASGSSATRRQRASSLTSSTSIALRRSSSTFRKEVGSYAAAVLPHLEPLPQPGVHVDIEDVVAEPSEDASELADAGPKVLVTPKPSASADAAQGSEPNGQAVDDDDEQGIGAGAPDERGERVCERCLRPDCVTVKPTVGLYTMEQIQRHCRPDDCWIVAHGMVFDVTRYLKKHPGGARSILSRVGGLDASADYDFHTKYSKTRLWPKFKIGRVAVCRNPPARRSSLHGARGSVALLTAPQGGAWNGRGPLNGANSESSSRSRGSAHGKLASARPSPGTAGDDDSCVLQ
mmetsp:Transcript_19341/g.61969  ORF Transcript_19341/g.61969 Transcript_19341/m.61969 type:complete len:399 (-) Transcript_19341:558-1754(-)